MLLALDCEPLHANLDGWLHGGLIEFVADTAMGLVARLEGDVTGSNRTLHLSVDFQEGAQVNDRVECAATVVHRTRRFVWTRCDLRRADTGIPVAACTAIQMLQGGTDAGS